MFCLNTILLGFFFTILNIVCYSKNKMENIYSVEKKKCLILGISCNFVIQRRPDWENMMFRLVQTITKLHTCWWFEIYREWTLENTIAVWHLKDKPIIYAIRRLVFYTSMVSESIVNSIVHVHSESYYITGMCFCLMEVNKNITHLRIDVNLKVLFLTYSYIVFSLTSFQKYYIMQK